VVRKPRPVTVRLGAIDGLWGVVRHVSHGNRIAIITDRTVGARYGRRVARQLKGSSTYTIPAGERHKNRKTWATLTDRMLADGFGRDTTIVALGGGVICDIAGFVAATYMRGVPCVVVPTTLLAMVDASIGGKTGVDTRHGKNLVGAFHQPSAVVVDPEVLKTLPPAQLRSGFAEILKHGAVADEAYFATARAFMGRFALTDKKCLPALTPIIERSITIKSDVVARDEKESGLRKVLNFGHTMGHAVEAASKYRLPHGNAVAIGMVFEAQLAERLGVAQVGTAHSIALACKAAGLPTSIPGTKVDTLLKFMHADKKARAGIVEYAMPARIGVMAGEDSGWSIAVKDTIVRELLSKKS
jgi:3-dehydroquinate synthase